MNKQKSTEEAQQEIASDGLRNRLIRPGRLKETSEARGAIW